jgi:adenylylsulfate kinase
MKNNVVWHSHAIDRQFRAAQKQQRPCLIWLTGLSGAGKSTIANLVEQQLAQRGQHTYLLDGDNVRHGLCRDLGFSDSDRTENIRRIGEVARLMNDAGLVVLTAFISPFRSDRDLVRNMFAPGEFIEVFVDAALAECERRDPKGMYKKARRGEITNFTGIDSPYEVPSAPELHLSSDIHEATQCAALVIDYLQRNGFIGQAAPAVPAP